MSDLIKRGQALKCAEHDTETYYALSCLPVVDAIPVEWIRKWMDRQNSWNLEGVITLMREWEERKEE